MPGTPINSADKDLKLSLRVRRTKGAVHQHPVNQLHHDEATFGERLADGISAGIGSWPFLIVQTIAVLIWLMIYPMMLKVDFSALSGVAIAALGVVAILSTLQVEGSLGG